MARRSIKSILMERDGLTAEEADEHIEDARAAVMERIAEGDFNGAEETVSDLLGLEPDYIDEFIF